jgi:hypothetical protein
LDREISTRYLRSPTGAVHGAATPGVVDWLAAVVVGVVVVVPGVVVAVVVTVVGLVLVTVAGVVLVTVAVVVLVTVAGVVVTVFVGFVVALGCDEPPKKVVGWPLPVIEPPVMRSGIV